MKKENLREFAEGILNSYTQIFFARDPVLAFSLIAVSFLSFFSGLSGLLAVIVTLGQDCCSDWIRNPSTTEYTGLTVCSSASGWAFILSPHPVFF